MNGSGGFPPEGTPLTPGSVQAQQQGGAQQQQGYPQQQVPRQGYPQQQAPPQQQQQAQPPQQQTPNQHPTVGHQFPQQGQQPQQQGQPQQGMQGTPQQQQAGQGQQQQQGGPTAQLDDNVVLDGPGVPPELRGRRWGQVKAIYNELADDYARRHFSGGQQNQQQAQQPQGQGQQQQPSYGQQQQPVQQQQPQGQQEDPRRRLFSDPQGLIREEVQRAIEPLQQTIQPIVQHTQQSQAMSARQRVAQRTPDWQQLESEILKVTRTAQPQALLREDFWEAAADIARGRMARNGQQPVQGQSYPGSQQPQQPQQQVTLPNVPAQQAGFPHMQPNQFFTEAPTVPSVYGGSHGGALNPNEAAVAQAMGMSEAEYMAWKGGVR